jgi:alpha-L-fucosidase
MKRLTIILLSFILLSTTLQAQKPGETEQQHTQRMQWWEEARFGMFIHWGIYSVPAGIYQGKEVPGIGEWIMNRGKIPMAEYQQYAAQFNPVLFNADSVVSLAKAAGMRYIVITSKHHDGFAMFRSDVSNFNVVDATPFKRDVIAEMAAACKKYGMRLGLYYSQAQDWNHPGGAANGGHWDKNQDGSMDEYIDKIAVPQMREILTKYGPISVLWFDTPRDMTPERAARIYDVLKLQPDIITNNRLGGGYSGDLETPEQYIPATGYPGRNWEACMTMNDTWGYKKNDKNFKSDKLLIRNLIDIASKGGNYLLNIGPTSEGLVPAESVERLRQIGKWMDVNGGAIHGTTSGPFNYLSWGRATRKGQTLYLHVFDWPAGGVLYVPLHNPIESVRLLADNRSLTFKTDHAGLSITLPAAAPDTIATVIAVKFKGEPVVPPIASLGRAAMASSTDSANESAANAFDGNAKTAWHAAKTDTTAWLQVDLGKPVAISAVAIQEGNNGGEQNIRAYRLEYQEGGEWKTLFEGGKIGRGLLKPVQSVNAQVFRLNVIKAMPGIQLEELMLMTE